MKADFFTANRHHLSQVLSGGTIVLTAYSAMQRGNDAAFAFEQEANFWYLTGIEAPDYRLIIDGVSAKSWLVMPVVSDVHQLFDGSLSAEAAREISGVDEVIDSAMAESLLGDLAAKHSVVYTLDEHPAAPHYDFATNPSGQKLRTELQRIFKDVHDCRPELAKLRAIKQPVEIAAIKKAVQLTATAFEDVKTALPKLKTEYEIEAEFTYAFRRARAAGHAYDPIVASGKNAVTLHYGDNNQKLAPHELVLLDIGARVDGYAADVTRTYAVGSPTARQIAVHTAVEKAQRRIIALLGPGVNVAEYHAQVDDIMRAAIDSLGLLKTPDDYRKYFPHAISHGLGIDVHDALGQPSELLPGMVLTVEPGIYIPEESIGVRIEDDILITPTGHDNLSGTLATSL